MPFTYNQAITRVRSLVRPLWEKNTIWKDEGVIFNALNDVAREYAMRTKDYESSASLALVAGTQDYVVSTAIGTDVDEVHLITVDEGTIRPREIRRFQEEIHERTYTESALSADIPQFFRIWNGTLRVVPTPSASETATVYYSPKVSILTYSVTNSATNVPLKDDYMNALVYESASRLYAQSGDHPVIMRGRPISESIMLHSQAEEMLAEAKAHQPEYGQGEQITYHDVVETDNTQQFHSPTGW